MPVQSTHLRRTAGTRRLLVAAVAASVAAAPQASAQFMPMPTAGVEAAVDAVQGAVGLLAVMRAKTVVDKSQAKAPIGLATDDAGSRLLIALAGGEVGVWNTADGRQTRRLQSGAGQIKALDVTDNGVAAALGGDGTVRTWLTATGQKHGDLGKGATAFALGRDGRTLFAGGADGSVTRYKVGGKDALGSIKGLAAQPAVMAASADGKHLLVGYANGVIGDIDLAAGKLARQLTAHLAPVRALRVTGGGTGLVSVGDDGLAVAWSLADGSEQRRVDLGIKSPLAVAISFKGDKVAVAGNDRQVKVVDLASGSTLATLTGHDENVGNIHFAANDAAVMTASTDATMRIWNAQSGQEAAKVVATDKGWSAVDSQGKFDSSGNGTKAIKVEAQNEEKKETLRLEQFSETNYEPGLVAGALAGKPIEKDDKTQDFTAGVAVPPKVKILTSAQDGKTKSDVVEVTVVATDEGAGVDEIRLFHNGKRLDGTTRSTGAVVKKGTPTQVLQTFQVPANAGENLFTAVALNTSKVESSAAEQRVTVEGEQKVANLHILAVGINTYKNPALSLNYGVDDAKGLTNALTQRGKSLFKDITVTQIFNDQATGANITTAVEALIPTKPEDVVVIYLAGHGETLQDDWYFIPYDVLYPEKPDHVKQKGIASTKFKEMVSKIGAGKVIFLMDACKSGAAVVAFRGFEERKALKKLARSTGVHVVAAAGKDQFASEIKDLGHGAFTYVLLEGLKGKADGSPKDGYVSIRELLSYVETELPEISEKQKLQAQFPVVDSQGQDFPVGDTKS